MLTFLISSAVIGICVGHLIWDWIHSDNYHPGALVKGDDMDASLFLAITLPLSFLVSAMVYRAARWQRVEAVADPAAVAPPTMGDQVKKTSTLAKESLTLSCFGVVAPPILGVFALAGIVCGHKAMRELRREPALLGRAQAVWGLVIGYLAIPVGVAEIYTLLWLSR